MFLNPGTNTPASAIAQPSQLSPPAVLLPAAPQPPARQQRPLHIVLIALLVAVLVGSGLLFAFFPPNRMTTLAPSNSVVGHVRFLSSSKPPPGNIDEAVITIQHIHDAPPGERYYAWLQIKIESSFPIHWPLPTQNGSISSPYQNTRLLTNKPYLLLITTEKTDNGVASFAPEVRLYYASLPADIQNLATFDIRLCPQDATNGICMS